MSMSYAEDCKLPFKEAALLSLTSESNLVAIIDKAQETQPSHLR
jgi:hypothetical protein